MTSQRLSLLPISLFMLLFAASAALGLLPAYDWTLSRVSLAAVLGSALLFLLVAYLARSQAAGRAVAAALAAVVTALALYFISQFGYQNYPETPALLQRLGRATTFLPPIWITYTHPNGVATLLEVVLPLAAALVVSSRRMPARLLSAAALAVLAYAMLLTFSRGAWIGLGAAAALFGALAALRRLPRRAAWALVIGGALALVAGAGVVLLLGPDKLPFLRSTFAAAESRLTLYRNTFYLATDYAFTGIGLGGTFGMVYSRFSLLIFVPFLTYAHNLFLAVWLGQGLLGLVALAGLVLAFYRLVYRTLRQTAPPALFHGAWLGVTASLIHGLTDARQYVEGPWTMPVFFATLALAGAMARAAFASRAGAAGPSEPAQPVRPAGRRAALLLAAALAAVMLVLNAPLRALWHTNLGAVDETRAELAPGLNDSDRAALQTTAAAHYRAALALDPGQPNANRRLGNLLVARGQYIEAVPLLEVAAAAEPDYPAAVKGLGLAYVWAGRIDDGARALARLDNRADIVNELGTWSVYRAEQNQTELAAYARQAAALLRLLPEGG